MVMAESDVSETQKKRAVVRRRTARAKGLTPTKARKILHDKEVRGHKLTDRQRRFFGAMSHT